MSIVFYNSEYLLIFLWHKNLSVNSSIIKWVVDFFVNQQQYVTVNGTRPSFGYMSMGAVLFTLFTHTCISSCIINCFYLLEFGDNHRREFQNLLNGVNYIPFLNVKKNLRK